MVAQILSVKIAFFRRGMIIAFDRMLFAVVGVLSRRVVVSCCALLWLVWLSGCQSGSNYVKVSPKKNNPFLDTWEYVANPDEGKASPRTEQFLRRYDLVKMVDGDPHVLLDEIHRILEKDPSPDGCHAYSELAYLKARQAEAKDKQKALSLYGAAVTHTYLFLFDPRFSQRLNPYDPQFRLVCNLYNDSLKSCLKLTHDMKRLNPEAKHEWKIGEHTWEVESVVRGCSWELDEFADFEFTADYEATGLVNQYHSFGLGVPLIAVRKPGKQQRAEERHFPPQLTFPMTAFVRLLPDAGGSHAHQSPQAGTSSKRHRAQLEFYDPLRSTDIVLDNRLVPLETDLSTPLAYFLSNPQLSKTDYSTMGLLNPEATAKIQGLYMLEPYSPYKIPVVLVHGLWSSPITWLEMFNDLQGDTELRRRYQFWFYLYPTGQPFWYSAARFRKDLFEMRDRLDPQRASYAMDQMVLVGHSMGGLVSKLQTVDSGDDFWRLVSDKSIQELRGRSESQAQLRELFYFQPNPSIKRVVTIGTPHLGSGQSNSATQWLGSKLITIPGMVKTGQEEIFKENPQLFRDKSFFNITTSIDSLSPRSPFLPVLYKARAAGWTRYHNIVGKVPQKGLYYFSAEGDGVVEYKNAVVPGVPEVVVPADHVSIHRHPLSILHVRSILHDHAGTRKSVVNPWEQKGPQPDTSTAGVGAPVMSSLGIPVPGQSPPLMPQSPQTQAAPQSVIQPSQFSAPGQTGTTADGVTEALLIDAATNRAAQQPGELTTQPNVGPPIAPGSQSVPAQRNPLRSQPTTGLPETGLPETGLPETGLPMADLPAAMPVRR